MYRDPLNPCGPVNEMGHGEVGMKGQRGCSVAVTEHCNRLQINHVIYICISLQNNFLSSRLYILYGCNASDMHHRRMERDFTELKNLNVENIHK